MAKKPRLIKVHSNSFHQAIQVIRQAEKKSKSLVVGKKKLSEFLMAVSNYTTSAQSLPNEVKSAILYVYGYSHPDPTTLKEDTKMSRFGFSTPNYMSLTDKFNRIAAAHNSGAKIIGEADVEDCTAVSDCIKLVSDAAATSLSKLPAI